MKKYLVSGLLLLSIIVPGVSQAIDADIDPQGNASGCISITQDLRYRSRDATTNGNVSTLQDFLQSKGYLNSEPTGYFGLLTFAAAKSFQSANNISPTGFVGPITRARINAISCGTGTVIIPPTPSPTPRGVAPTTSYTPPVGTCGVGWIFDPRTGERCDKKPAPTNQPFAVLTPSGGENYKAGETVNIRWTESAYDAQRLFQSIWLFDGRKGETRYLGRASLTAKNVQNFSWTIPYDLATGYGYEIKIGDNAPAYSGIFSITNGATSTIPSSTPFRVLFPTSSSTLQSGQTYNITWSGEEGYADLGSYSVYLTNGNGESYSFSQYLGEAYPTAKSVDVFQWTVPSDISSGQYYLNFSAKAAGGFSERFSITGGNGCSANLDWSPTTGEACRPTPEFDVSASPTRISSGQSSTITVSTIANATGCDLYYSNGQVVGWSGGSRAGSNGYTHVYEAYVSPTQTTTYTATCFNSVSGGNTGPYKNRNVTIGVLSIPVSPTATPDGCSPGWTFSPTTGEACYTIYKVQ